VRKSRNLIERRSEYRRMTRKIALSIGILLVGAAPAGAVLGESVRSVQDDQQRMRGALISMTREGYSIQQISSPSGHVIKEYVSLEGTVFGVSWQGPAVPDLQPLLGSYFAQLQEATLARPRRHGPLIVRTDKVVIENGGHQRAFHGRAYVPSLLPQAVSPAVVQ
jgi:hypothetical protein